MNAFLETGLDENIFKAIEELGFKEPTPIQAKTIPHLLASDQDLIALAQTGTGKTAAFGLPAIQLTDVEDKGTQTIILCPTRELCLQIARDLGNYSKYIKGLAVVPVYGGASIDTQIRALRKAAQIVVGTPGRVNDLIRRKRLKLGNVKRVILDEADEMLTMGFKEEIDTILAETPDEKQTLLFSATMSKRILSISSKFMNDPMELSVARMNLGAENVKHLYYMVQARDKYELLKRVADINPNIYGIVFCRTRRDTGEIASKLMDDGYNADAIHGDLSQAQRDEVMGRFRSKALQILVATDVAARGLDVNDLTHVINFTLPDDDEVYIHRSGRTGRAGKSGVSIAVIHSRERRKLQFIEKKAGITFEQATPPNGLDICKTRLFALIEKIKNVEVDEEQLSPFLPEIYEKLESLSREEIIQHFVSNDFNRYLTYYKNARDLSSKSSDRSERGRRDRGDRNRDRRDDRDSRRRDRKRDRRDRERGDRSDSRESSRGRDRFSRDKEPRVTWENKTGALLSRMFINLGTKNNLTPGALIALINNSLNSGDAEIGMIDIKRKFSFFEVEKKFAQDLIAGMKGKDFEGTSISLEVSQGTPGLAKAKDKQDKSGSPKGYGKIRSARKPDRNKRNVNKRIRRK